MGDTIGVNGGGLPQQKWHEIRGPRGLWFPGIFVVVDRATGRPYLVQAANVGKRVYDQVRLLDQGAHHNAALQADRSARRGDFRLYLIERCANDPRWLVRLKRQLLIDAATATAGGCYNAKRAIPARRRDLRPHG